jgi:hypothetical protein
MCWLLHLVGDIHQPLHCVAFFSAEYPTGDQGGNLRLVKDGETPINLHAYWDNLLGSDTSYGGVKSNAEILSRAEYGRDRYAKELGRTKYMEWAEEGSALAWEHVYLAGDLPGLVPDRQSPEKKKDAPALPRGYAESAQRMARRQAALAGFRLADEVRAVLTAKE